MINGEIIFNISDDNNLDVSFSNNIEPTREVKKGEIKLLGRESKNQWMYVRAFNGYNEFHEEINTILSKLCEVRDEIQVYKAEYDYVGLTIYLRSDYGQIGCVFSENEITKIALLGIGLSIDIISGGRV